MKINFVVTEKSKSLDVGYLNYIYSFLFSLEKHFYNSILVNKDVLLTCSDDGSLTLIFYESRNSFSRSEVNRFVSLGLQSVEKLFVPSRTIEPLKFTFDRRLVNPNFIRKFEFDNDDVILDDTLELTLFGIFSRRFVQLDKAMFY